MVIIIGLRLNNNHTTPRLYTRKPARCILYSLLKENSVIYPTLLHTHKCISTNTIMHTVSANCVSSEYHKNLAL